MDTGVIMADENTAYESMSTIARDSLLAGAGAAVGVPTAQMVPITLVYHNLQSHHPLDMMVGGTTLASGLLLEKTIGVIPSSVLKAYGGLLLAAPPALAESLSEMGGKLSGLGHVASTVGNWALQTPDGRVITTAVILGTAGTRCAYFRAYGQMVDNRTFDNNLLGVIPRQFKRTSFLDDGDYRKKLNALLSITLPNGNPRKKPADVQRWGDLIGLLNNSSDTNLPYVPPSEINAKTSPLHTAVQAITAKGTETVHTIRRLLALIQCMRQFTDKFDVETGNKVYDWADTHGKTPLHYIERVPNGLEFYVAATLLSIGQCGCDPNKTDDDERPCFFYAKTSQALDLLFGNTCYRNPLFVPWNIMSVNSIKVANRNLNDCDGNNWMSYIASQEKGCEMVANVKIGAADVFNCAAKERDPKTVVDVIMEKVDRNDEHDNVFPLMTNISKIPKISENYRDSAGLTIAHKWCRCDAWCRRMKALARGYLTGVFSAKIDPGEFKRLNDKGETPLFSCNSSTGLDALLTVGRYTINELVQTNTDGRMFLSEVLERVQNEDTQIEILNTVAGFVEKQGDFSLWHSGWGNKQLPDISNDALVSLFTLETPSNNLKLALKNIFERLGLNVGGTPVSMDVDIPDAPSDGDQGNGSPAPRGGGKAPDLPQSNRPRRSTRATKKSS